MAATGFRNPRRPTRLPLLFALDKKLGVANGFVYALDCNEVRRKSTDGSETAVVHFGANFGSTSFDGSTAGSQTLRVGAAPLPVGWRIRRRRGDRCV